MSFKVRIEKTQASPVIILTDSETGSEIELYAFGGLLNAFRVNVNDQLFNIIDGFNSVDDAVKNIVNGFKSTKLSPFVCRMKEGRYQFQHKPYKVNKHYLNGHAIHGLLYDAVFNITGSDADDKQANVTLAYDYDGHDEGYPFLYHITINWKLETGNKLTVTTTVSHTNATDIPYADGWHPYFTLGGKVDEWNLQFDSTSQLEYNADLLPTGDQFKDERFINGGSLHNIELDNSFELKATGHPPKCVLSNKAMRLLIEPDSSYPLLQVYIPPHRNSIAIENLSGAPNNFNNGMGLLLLAPNEEKVFTTSYTLKMTV